MGGENSTLSRGMRRVAGSSPRGRGKRLRWPLPWASVGLIPAWAGKTLQGGHTVRRCGGSSPRGRGKPQRLTRAIYLLRLIPAWAGKTTPRRSLEALRKAHPRVGGENELMAFATSSFVGSSPRGRGKRDVCEGAQRIVGLIPAWAGKTRPRVGQDRQPRAHPRVGGENLTPFG